MKKIPTLFLRDPVTHLVFDLVTPGCEWVLNLEGVATVKLDGSACLWKGGELWKRFDAKRGKKPPAGFLPAQDPDPNTGHWPGWVLVSRGNAADKWHVEALDFGHLDGRDIPLDCNGVELAEGWTYELCGPRLNGNPEQFGRHVLVRHGQPMPRSVDWARDFKSLRLFLEMNRMEGIVWWRDPSDPDCAKVKIKARDFGLAWPVAS